MRFAPPLVIEEEDLRRAIRIIGECLEDLDNVCIMFSLLGISSNLRSSFQLDDIPGDVGSEQGHTDIVTN